MPVLLNIILGLGFAVFFIQGHVYVNAASTLKKKHTHTLSLSLSHSLIISSSTILI
jgi:hypothetical protein